MVTELVSQIMATSPLEALALLFGIVAVVLLIGENVWTWPAGIGYVVVSLWIFWHDALYAQLVLHVFFFAMNAYGWYYWVHGRDRDGPELPVRRSRPRELWVAGLCVLLGIAIAGTGFSLYTDASLVWWDNTVTMISFAAMWMSARKQLENWALWLLADVLAAPMFAVQGLWMYALLYLVYVPMAVAGWRAWQRSMHAAAHPHVA